jgi:hypothetical protein
VPNEEDAMPDEENAVPNTVPNEEDAMPTKAGCSIGSTARPLV